MSVTLNSIAFNHDPQSASRSALNIRRDKDFEVQLPEWPWSAGETSADRPAAYSIEDTDGQDVVVEVTLSATAAGAYEIRATGGGVLGEIAPTRVDLGIGNAVTVDLVLARRRFGQVGRHDVQWQWSYRPLNAASWTPLASSEHRIYLTLASPRTPWVQSPGSAHLPWADLLDYVCVAAGGWAQNHPASIGRSLVWAINESLNLRYDVVTAGSGRYGYFMTGDQFELSAWIEFVLRNHPPPTTVCDPESGTHPLEQTVGCYDTAAALAVMCAVIGVELRYQFHEPFGFLNPCLPIGRPHGNNPHYYPSCITQPPLTGPDTPRTHFVNHTYTADAEGRVYDACLRASVDFFACFIYLVVAVIWALCLRLDLAYEYWDRAHGVMTRRTQQDYEATFIDVSTPLEQGQAGGAPVMQTVDVRVV